MVIPNAPKDLSKIKKALLERGQVVCDTRLLTGPLAIVSVASFVDAKTLLEADKPFSVDGTTMQFIRLDESKDAIARLLLGNTTKSVFVTRIPKSITMELLKSKLPASCVPTGSWWISTGPKSKFFNAAYLNFDSKESSAEFSSNGGYPSDNPRGLRSLGYQEACAPKACSAKKGEVLT
ncbi:hypothetical protein EG68_04203 [Paragonimus skrjabini miyazakii]|uniref:Uncharacterized protein n=1 Tax=Paragonimus skrjabini miyazakii TaxID=59628 RepID=A0A8S9YUU5_9TREM|nr:hypothetical protein EG68_04203 [Paragonimus skrjabini miyazakii]